MSAGAVTLLAVAISLAALLWLAASDPKRRRAFRLPQPGPDVERRRRSGWAIVLLPGLLALFGAGGAGLVLWLGATTVLGWALVALPPDRLTALHTGFTDGLRARIAAFGQQGATIVAALRRLISGRGPAGPSRIAELEARITALEAELFALRGGIPAPDHLVVHAVEFGSRPRESAG